MEVTKTMKLANDLCPDCEGQLNPIIDGPSWRWICQRPCGFETHSSLMIARIILAQAIKQHRAIEKFIATAEDALPGNSIKADFQKAIKAEG